MLIIPSTWGAFVSKFVDENYVNRMSIERLRTELTEALDLQFELSQALHDKPELPSPRLLHHLGQSGTWPDDSAVGKMLQRKHGLDAIPPVSECESGAGVWWRIRQGLVTALPETIP